MPKTVSAIWNEVISFDSLYFAFLRAQEGLRDAESVLRYRGNLEENLITLQNELIWHTWRPLPPRFFTIYEPKMAKLYADDKLDIRKIEQVIASYLGYMKHCNGYRTTAAFLEELVFSHAKEEISVEDNQ